MLRGSIALAIRYMLLMLGTSLATTGIITASGADQYCFNVRTVADAAAYGLVLTVGGGASVAASIVWRFWAKKKGGVT